jgi:hypothetical protein
MDNKVRLYYKYKLVNAVEGNNVWYKHHTQHMNTLCGEKRQYFNVKAGGTYPVVPLYFKKIS